MFIYSVTKAKRCDYTVVWQTLIIILSAFYCFSVEAATVTESLKVIEKTNQISINSQKKIDQLSVQTQRMLEEYQRLLHNTEYQDAYNQELSQLKIDQDVEINSLQSQRNDIKVTQMRIMPLMRSMADALERFVILDLPFKQQERVNGVMQLKQRLRSPSLSIPEKYRLILEAFQIEIDYGRTIEAYRDSLNRGDESISVEYLRIGRVGFYYQTLDGQLSGYWNAEERNWHVLPEQYNQQLKVAMRVAKNQLAPQLISVPMINNSTTISADQEQ